MLGAGRAVRFTVALVAVAMLFAACDSGDDDNDDNDDADDAESTEETALAMACGGLFPTAVEGTKRIHGNC